MKRVGGILLFILLCISMTGCNKNGSFLENIGLKKNLNLTVSDLLIAAAEELDLAIEEDEAPDHPVVTTYNLSAFSELPTEEFENWIFENCVGENREAVIVTKGDERWKTDTEMQNYLIERGYSVEETWGAEWKEMRFSLEEGKTNISFRETVYLDIIFRSYNNEGFGMKVNCRYKKGEWITTEAENGWIS